LDSDLNNSEILKMYYADGEGLPGTYLEVRPPGTVIVGTPDVFLIVAVG